MLPTAGPKLPARLRAPFAALALLSCVACSSTDRLRIEAGDPLGADFVYVVVDSKKIETNFESDANEALLTPARIREYPAYAQLDVDAGKWRVVELRKPAAPVELELDGAAFELDLGFLFEDRKAYSLAIVTQSGSNWRAKVLGLDDFRDSHELLFVLRSGYPERKE